MGKRKQRFKSRGIQGQIKYALKDFPWGRKLHYRDKEGEDARLALLAKEFGVAVLMVLTNDLGMTTEEADKVLGKIIEQAKANRGMVYTKAALENIKKLNEVLEEGD